LRFDLPVALLDFIGEALLLRPKSIFPNLGTPWRDAIERSDANRWLLGDGSQAEPLAAKGDNRLRVEVL
jgi:hypothetical protein